MIVVDVNVVAYLYLPGRFGDLAEDLLLREPEWAVPRLWRSEFRNILCTYMRQGTLSLDAALAINASAEDLLVDHEYDIAAMAVLRLARDSGCSAYDCEYVALAEHLDVRLVTADTTLRKAFPRRAVDLSEA